MLARTGLEVCVSNLMLMAGGSESKSMSVRVWECELVFAGAYGQFYHVFTFPFLKHIFKSGLYIN